MKPFLLRPVGKDYLWGGDLLNTRFGKQLPLSPLAETWECSVHPDGRSTVASGVHCGMSLAEVLRTHPAYLGEGFPDGLPILVKLIDAKQDLSVQVHPDDAYARAHEGDNGKSELWYILDAAPGASLIYGFRHEVTEEEVRRALRDGTLGAHLNRIPVSPGDAYYIPAGTVHAIGAGLLIAEIQESSNVTYRVWDYDRRDKEGQLRPLHIDRALEVMQLHAAPPPPPPAVADSACAQICDCPYFTVDRFTVAAPLTLSVGHRFRVLLITEGTGQLLTEDGDTLPLTAGDCIFCPADTEDFCLTGALTLLAITCKPTAH